MKFISLARKAPAAEIDIEAELIEAFPPMSRKDRKAADVQAELEALDLLIAEKNAIIERERKDRDDAVLIREGLAKLLASLTGYDAADDARKSYEVAIEAKRKRGDKHFPRRASDLAAAE